MSDQGALRKVLRVDSNTSVCTLDGGCWTCPPVLAKFLRSSDRLAFLPDCPDSVHVDRLNTHGRLVHYLYCRVVSWSGPIRTKAGEYMLRAVADSKQALFLAAASVAAYFYASEDFTTLYEQVGARRDASTAELRNRWRIRNLELAASGADHAERLRTERAFNILMSPDLRPRYDSKLAGDENPMPLPYAGPGDVLVEGKLPEDGGAFFGTRIVAYRPATERRKVPLLLRGCEFLEDRVICHDSRRKLEVWLDRAQLPGISWDLTWNRSKRWLQSRLTVDATFVRTCAPHGEICLTALPSRTQIILPEGINEDISQAAIVQRLVGQNAEVFDRIRSELRREPIEHRVAREWLDHLDARDVEPELAIWESDYDRFYFQTLRARSQTWFLYRDEFLFVLPQAVISEIPQAGHASYAFAKPTDLGSFLRRYSEATREDIRTNRNNAATNLGFIGRIVRGTDKTRWAQNVLKVACGTSNGC